LLNDLLAIEKGLKAHGIPLADRHPDVKDMAKGWALRVRLGTDGRIAALDFVAEAGRGALWTLRDGQHNGFPGLKTGAGLLHLEDQARDAHAAAWESDKTPGGRRRELLRLYGNNSVNADQLATWPNVGHRKRIGERLQSLRSLTNDPLTAAVPAAFERFLAALDASPSFLEDLLAAVAKRIQASGDEWLDRGRAALTGPIALAIDVIEDEFDRDACDPRQVGAVSAALSASLDPVDSHAECEGLCALSGESAKLHSGNFPQPNLPGLGQTYIFSRNRDIPSLTRYGRTADASFPVDSGLLRRLAGAISKLTEEDEKGRTWRLIPAESGDKPDLLVVSMAEPGLRPADAFSDDDEVGGEAALRELASRVLDQSRGEYEHESPQSEVTVLILRTVDPANRKTIYHRKTTSAEVWDAARRWQAAKSNTPDWLTLPFPGTGKSEVVLRRAPYVAPLSIVPISRIQFANGGRRRISVIGTTAAAAFSLFLHEGDVGRSARSLLRLLIRRHESLLGGLAAARAKGTEYLKDFDPKADLRRDALRSITWIGALLHHLGHYNSWKPEMSDSVSYANGLAFRLGQFLAAADVIHVGYCADLRGGDVPPNLLGNSVLTIAGSDPTRALSILQTRLKPYLGWAKRVDSIYAKAAAEERLGNKNRAIALRRGVSQARRSEEIANDVHAMLAPYKSKSKKPDDAFKAELLLGYVAGLPPIPRKPGDPLAREEDGQIERNEGEQG
jgi:hypothetical protein